jgi:hypothetical protein
MAQVVEHLPPASKAQYPEFKLVLPKSSDTGNLEVRNLGGLSKRKNCH